MKRKNVVKVLLGCMALSTVAAVAALSPTLTASAETVAETDFACLGASVRYDTPSGNEGDDGTGLRVVIQASDAYLQNAEEIGFLVIPSNKLEVGEELTVYTENAVMNAKSYVSTEDTTDDWTVSGDYQVASSYIYDIPVSASEWEITVRGYAKVDGNYEYTDVKTRSMRSVAVAVSKDSATSEDMRTALTKYMDEGNVAYLGSQYTVHNDTEFTAQISPYGSVYKGTATTPAGVTVDTLCVGTAAVTYDWCNVYMKTPAIKNITGYKYMYLWVYTESQTNKTDYHVSFNLNYPNNAALTPNAWTRVVFENVGGVWKTNGQDLFTGSYTTSATNMDGFVMSFYAIGTTEPANFQFTQMYVCNELPTLSVTTDATGFVMPGTAINVSTTSAGFDTTDVTYTTYAECNGVITKVDGTSFTPTQAGVYKFIVVAEKNGKLIARGDSAQVNVIYEEGNVSYWNYVNGASATGTKISGMDLSLSYGFSTGYDTDKVPPSGGVAFGVYGEHWVHTWGPLVELTNPAIKDVSSYKYLYLWVYTMDDAGVSLLFNHVARAANVEKGQWTRIVLEKAQDGNFYLNGTAVFNTDRPATDMSTFSIRIQQVGFPYDGANTAGATGWTYFSGLYACNELPALS